MMTPLAQWTLQPVITPLPKQNKMVLAGNFYFQYKKLDLYIPSGFKFDGCSIPRLFWTTTGSPYLPRYLLPGLIHDFLYEYQPVSRQEADKLFYELLRRQGISRYTAGKMYAGVRMGGWLVWKRFSKELTNHFNTT